MKSLTQRIRDNRVKYLREEIDIEMRIARSNRYSVEFWRDEFTPVMYGDNSTAEERTEILIAGIQAETRMNDAVNRARELNRELVKVIYYRS